MKNINDIYLSPIFNSSYIQTSDGFYHSFISFKVKNLSIMDDLSASEYISSMSRILVDLGNTSLISTDIEHNLSGNIQYLKERIKNEKSEKIKELLKKDLSFISGSSSSLPSKRIFLITLKEKTLDTLNEKVIIVSKILSRYNLDYEKLEHDEVKNLLLKYFFNKMRKEDMEEYAFEKILSNWEYR